MIEYGMPAIALKGIWMACNKGTNELRAEIKPYIKYGRVTYVCFDQDSKPKTIVSVKKAITKIGIAIKKASTRFLEWDGKFGKGIDDYLMNFSVNDRAARLSQLIKDAAPVKQLAREAGREEALKARVSRYPAIELTGKYIGEIKPVPGGIIGLDAFMGSGKTWAMAELIKQETAKGNLSLAMSPLNSICRQLAEMAGLLHMHDAQGNGLGLMQGLVRENGGAALCPESLWKMPWIFEDPNFKLLILDEATAIINNILTGGNLGANAPKVSRMLESVVGKVLERGGTVIVAQDGLTDETIDILSAFVPQAPITKFSHRGSREAWNCRSYTDREFFREQMMRAIEATSLGGKPIAICTSSQIAAETIEAMAFSIAPDMEVHRIDSKTNRDGLYTDFFRDPDAWLKKTKPQVLLYSPSVKSGVSIEGGVAAVDCYFQEVWGLFESGDCDMHKQMLARIRPGIDRHFYCSAAINLGKGGNKAERMQQLIEQSEALQLPASTIVQPFSQNMTALSQEAAERISQAILRATVNLEYQQMSQGLFARDVLNQSLEQRGHKVVAVTEKPRSQAIQIAWKDSKALVQDKEAAAIAHARELTAAQYKELSKKECSLEDSIACQRYRLKKSLGGQIEITPELVTGLLFRSCDRASGYLKQAKLTASVLDFMANGLKSVDFTRDAASNAALIGGEIKFHARAKNSFLEAALLGSLGILDLYKRYSKSNEEFTPESPEMIELERLAGTFKQCQQILGFEAVGKRGTEIFKICLRRLGLDKAMIETGKKRGKTVDKVRVYSIAPTEEPTQFWTVVEAIGQGNSDWLDDFKNSQEDLKVANQTLEGQLAAEIEARSQSPEWEIVAELEAEEEPVWETFEYEPDS